MQALAGDSTDNVPGVPGIGVKTAAQLINEYGDLETLLAAPARSSSPSGARRCSRMPSRRASRASWCTLRDDVPTPAEPEAFDKRKPDPNVLLPWLEQQGFKSLLARFTGELGEATSPVAPAAPRRAAGRCPRRSPSPRRRPRAKSNQPFTAADYELISDEKALDDWIAEATRAGAVAFDCETDALDANNAGLVGVSLALLEGPWGDVNSASGARPTCRSAIAARRRGAGRARPPGDGGAKDAGDLLPARSRSRRRSPS